MMKTSKPLPSDQQFPEESTLLKKVDVEGFEGLYQITEAGEVYSLYTDRFLTHKVYPNGYAAVNLYKYGKCHTRYIHRLVATAFVPNPLGLLVVMHKDNDKLNNCVCNLKWGTSVDNAQAAMMDGICNVGKKVLQLSKDGAVLNTYNSMSEAARALGKPSQTGGLSLTCNGLQKTWMGYKWRFEV